MVAIDTERIKEAARGRWAEILTTLGGIPRESLDGRHHPCPKCGGTDRFRMIDAEAGALFCNHCFDANNGDGFAALQWATGQPFPAVVRMVADHVGAGMGNGNGNGNGHHKPNGKQAQTYATSAEARAVYVKQLGEPTTWWEYLDASGQCAGFVYRWDTPKGKEVRPVARIGDKWVCGGMPEPRPLYRLPEITTAEVVYVVEGEKAAEALRDAGLTVTTSPHGSKSAKQADWSPLAGKTVCILPDNDTAGAEYAETVKGLLAKVKPAPAVKLVDLPDLPEKGDAHDYVQRRRSEGATLPEIRAEVEALAAQATAEQAEPPAFAKLIDCRELLALNLRPRYLVRGVLVAGQPAVIGGRSKCLKTSVAIDLAVSLGSGTPYLNCWPAERCRVGVWSGESGAATIRETAQRIAAARDVALEDCDILWAFALPRLSRADHLDLLRETITGQSIDVAIVDPLYLALLDAETAGQASNVFAMGAALQPVGEIGQATGCTMIVLHHFRKGGGADPDEPASLEELSQSGVVEWARQWLLLARRTPYQSDGRHELWQRIGGSAGHAGLYAVDIEEGLIDPDTLDGRRWDVAVRSVADARAETRQAVESRKAEQASKRQQDDCRKMLEALRRSPSGDTMRALRGLAGLSGERAADAVRALVGEGRAEQIEITKYRRKETGYRATDK